MYHKEDTDFDMDIWYSNSHENQTLNQQNFAILEVTADYSDVQIPIRI